ncbi:MAG: TerB family tellurite resistance protein [Parabacteroides sp.]|nr:TerB family tellurite resistance protein [Parabacteroides sp.]
MGIGKWIGGVLGFMAFGPLGALGGIILGSFFEGGANMTGQSFGGGSSYSDEYTQRDADAGQRNSFLFSMLVMASYIIRADGKIMHSEMEYVRQFLRRNFGEIAVGQGEEILLKLFDQAKRMDQESGMGFKNTIRECGTQIAYSLSYEERLQLLAFLAEIAKSDGNVCAAEIEALKEIAMAMGMSDREVESMLNLQGNSLDDAYKVLEIESTATDEEVRTAYRRMAVKHHPDKVANLGEDIRKAANEKLQKINEAKERIYKARGLK